MNTDRITAINLLRPRAVLNPLMGLDILAAYVASRANLSVSDVSHALEELHNAVIFFCSMGHSVKLDGLGIYSPAVELDGSKTINYRIDRMLVKEFSVSPFTARIENAENIGKTPNELVTLWNETHPDVPVAP